MRNPISTMLSSVRDSLAGLSGGSGSKRPQYPHGFISTMFLHKHMVMIKPCHYIRTNSNFSQCSRNRRCKSNCIQAGMNVKSNPFKNP